MGEFNANLETMLDKVVDRNLEASKETADALSTGRYIIMVLLFISLVLGIYLSVVVTKSIVRPIDLAISGLSTGSDQVTSAAQQISGSSQSLASGASEQAASLEEISSSLNQITTMTKQTADNVKIADALVKESGVKMSVGKESMTKLQNAVMEIQQSSNETAKILKDIDEIAFQTNLLALNAAVEAARAGEAGKGFAVVAEEVRNLAQRSAESAKKTAALIETSQHKSQIGVDLVDDTAKAIDDAATNSQKVGMIVSEITTAADEQARRISHVNAAVRNMDQVTQSNASASEELAASSQELGSQAISMNDLVSELVGVLKGEEARVSRGVRYHSKISTIDSSTTQRIAIISGKQRAPKALIPFNDDN
jgi:methyl-accepting chemotaxis protein